MSKEPGTGKPLHKKPELTDADKPLIEVDPDWERAGQIARRLMATPPAKPVGRKAKPTGDAS